MDPSLYCNPVQLYCNPGRPYQWLSHYFTPLICGVQQPDFRPLQYGGGTNNNRFAAKENYGPQCQFVFYNNFNPPMNTSWFPDHAKYDCCVPKAGCPASYIVPHTVALIHFPAKGSSPYQMQLFHRKLLGVMYDYNIDRIDVLCQDNDDRFDLIDWLKQPQGFMRATKVKPYLTGCPVDEACMQDYQRRFLQGQNAVTIEWGNE